MTPRPDYGLDAPPVIRNLSIAAVVAGGLTFVLPRWLAIIAALSAALCALEAAYMIWSSRKGKLIQRELLLDEVPWDRVGRVLDVGCGRGLLMVGAARRLRATGLAIGLDLWRSEDLAGNRPEAALTNARLDGVDGRARVVTGDMRRLPLADASIDVVLSSLAIHNVPTEVDRDKAIAEIARVVKANGVVILQDFQHVAQYEAALRNKGFSTMKVSGRQFRIFPPTRFLVARRG